MSQFMYLYQIFGGLSSRLKETSVDSQCKKEIANASVFDDFIPRRKIPFVVDRWCCFHLFRKWNETLTGYNVNSNFPRYKLPSWERSSQKNGNAGGKNGAFRCITCRRRRIRHFRDPFWLSVIRPQFPVARIIPATWSSLTITFPFQYFEPSEKVYFVAQLNIPSSI